MSVVAETSAAGTITEADGLYGELGEPTRAILRRRTHARVTRRRGWLVRRALLVSDIAGLLASFVLAELLFGRGSNARTIHAAIVEFAVFVLSVPVWVVAAKLYGLYDRDEERAQHSTADDVMGVFHLVTVEVWLLFALAYLSKFGAPEVPKLLTFWITAVIAVPLLRGVARAWCRRSVHYLQNTVIVGAGEVGQQVARKLLRHAEYGINLVGFVDVEPQPLADDVAHVAVLGDLDGVPELVGLLDLERVIVSFTNEQHDRLSALIRRLNELHVQVDLVPRLYELVSPAADVHTVEGLPLLGLRPPRLARSSAFLKRALDVGAAALGLVVFFPLFCLAAICIKLDSPGPVLFRQVRMGADQAFPILKFRTMVTGADAQKSELAHLNKHGRTGDCRMFKVDDDPRVTRVGRLLRRFSLDELPQLWNVLRGEMSLVGPRPLILAEHAHVADWAGRRLDLRPGMTGLWQVLGRDDIPFAEMVSLDYLYVTNWSLGGDLGLLLRTLPSVLRRGA